MAWFSPGLLCFYSAGEGRGLGQICPGCVNFNLVEVDQAEAAGATAPAS